MIKIISPFWLAVGIIPAWVISDRFLWSFSGIVLRPIDVYVSFLIILCFGLFLIFTKQIKFYTNIISIVFLLLIVLGAFSILWSKDKTNTIIQSTELLELYLVLFFFPILFKSENQLKVWFNFLLLTCFINEFVFFLVMDVLFPSIQLGSYHRVRGEMWFSGIGLAIAFGYFIGTKKFKPLYLILVIFFFLLICFSLTRTVLIGSLSSVICILFAKYNSFKKLSVRLILLFFIGSMIFINVSFFLPFIAEGQSKRIGDLFALFRGDEDVPKSVEGRLAVLIAVEKTFKNNPILGVGLGCFKLELEKYRGTELSFENSSKEAKIHKGSHNNFASMLGDLGLLGFSFYVFLTFSPILLIKKFRRNPIMWKHPEVILSAIGIWPSTIAYLLFMPFNTVTRFTLTILLSICIYLLPSKKFRFNF